MRNLRTERVPGGVYVTHDGPHLFRGRHRQCACGILNLGVKGPPVPSKRNVHRFGH